MRNLPEQENAFVALVRSNERLIYKVCSFYASEKQPIADLYQEVVLNLWRAFPSFKEQCAVSTWMYRIALNTCISDLRKASRRPKCEPLQAWADLLPEPDSMTESIQEMYRLIRRLKTLERAIVLLHLEEKSNHEIAEITGLTQGNVATKLTRIREKLKQMSNY
jgi:RNA polymerase sigma-70 factor (ECF subfamily)